MNQLAENIQKGSLAVSEVCEFINDGGDSRDAILLISEKYDITKSELTNIFMEEIGIHPDKLHDMED